MSVRAKTNPEELNSYLDAGWQLIPLHRFDKTDTFRDKEGKEVVRKRGKSPVDTDWVRKPYDSRKVADRAAKGKGNTGVRLRPEDLVLDVDPRNFPEGETLGGDNPFRRLCTDIGFDPYEWPSVETGSGGLHIYMSKPADASVRDSLPDYPGVEFKTYGRQVVAAGSIHPDTLKPYVWDFLSPPLGEAKPAPDILVNIIRRPKGALATGGGEHTQEEVAAMLDALDPLDFRNHDDWFRLMMACHHASGGDARSEFVEWSTRDPAFSGHEGIIGRRWDSLHADSSSARITYKTLHKILRDADREDVIPRTPPEDDFEALSEEDMDSLSSDKPDDLVNKIVDQMNERFCVVLESTRFLVFMEDTDDTFNPPRRVWTRLSREAFLNYHEDERVKLPDSTKEMNTAQIWLRSPRRRKYPGIVMDPEGRHPEKLNLWRGWSVLAAPGNWSMLRGLIQDVLCGGDAASGEYVLRWIAFMLQRPWVSPEVAIAFRGGKGTGKGTLGRVLMKIAGVHGLTVASPTQFAGRFNAHLRDVAFLFADEAFWPGHKEAEGILKQLVTEPVISYESKGKDIVSGRNLVHMLMASNENWLVPASIDERRFAVFNVTTERQNDRAFFERLWAQLDGGGLGGMVYDLLKFDLDGWHPSQDVPHTEALADQKLMGLEPGMKWWHELLDKGELPASSFDDSDWKHNEITLDEKGKNALVADFDSFLKRNRVYHLKATHKAIVESGKLLGLTTIRLRRGSGRGWKMPPLQEMRQRLEKLVGTNNLFV